LRKLGSNIRETIKEFLVLLILFVLSILLIAIIFLCAMMPFIQGILLFITIDQVLEVLIFFFEFFLDFNVDKLRVVNANRARFGFLSHDLVNQIECFKGQLNILQSLLVFHFWIDERQPVRHSMANGLW